MSRRLSAQVTMLLSRVAEQLYWAARYVQRTEDTARVIAEHTKLLVDLPTSVPLTWEPLLAVPGLRHEFDRRYPDAGERNVITFLLADRDNPSSVVASVVAARDDLRSAREVVPREAWQALNDLYLYATSHHVEAVDRRSRLRFLDRVVAETQRFAGILSGTMSRDDAYHMLLLGRNLERADMTTRVLDVRAVTLLAPAGGNGAAPAHDEVQWAAVLRSLSALQAYHRRHRGPTAGPATVAFLLGDPDFPGSVRHCLAEVTTVLGELPSPGSAALAAARAAVRALDEVAEAPLDRLHDGLDRLQRVIAAVHDEVSDAYFPPPVADRPRVRTVDLRSEPTGRSD